MISGRQTGWVRERATPVGPGHKSEVPVLS